MPMRQLPFTLRPPKDSLIIRLLTCAAFTAGGVWMISQGDIWGWLAAFFAVGGAVFLVQLLFPDSSFLTVGEDGLTIRSLFRKSFVEWSDISGFGTYGVRLYGLGSATSVGFNYLPSFSGRRRLSQAMAGYEAGLPHTYGLPARELADILTAIHAEMTRRRTDIQADQTPP